MSFMHLLDPKIRSIDGDPIQKLVMEYDIERM